MALASTVLRDLIVSEIDSQFGIIPTRFRASVISFSDALATAIVAHITEDGVVNVKTTDVGLQRDPVSSTDTLGPSTNKTLTIS